MTNTIEIPIGGTCCGWFDSDAITTTDEIRKLESDRHEPIYSDVLVKNLGLKRQLIINFDSYNNGRPRGWTSESNFRKLIEDTISETYEVGQFFRLSKYQVGKLVTITGDNEANEIYSIQEYVNWMKILISQVRGRFEIGLGNFNGLRSDWYDYICRKVEGFRYLDVHLQKDFETIEKINANLPKLKHISNCYGKELRVTEAFPTGADLWTDAGYNLLIHQLNKSIEYEAKAFCCFIRFDRSGDYRKLAFLRGTGVHEKWNDFKELIELYKPNINLEDEDMRLERFYYKNRPKYLIEDDEDGYGIIFLRKCFGLSHGNVFDDALTNKVKQYQQEHNLLVDGKVGPETFGDIAVNLQGYDRYYCSTHSLWARRLL